jgi:hypothetical protein|nr:hypothetical protein TQ38_24555 [Novosphingobium sp. P6W]
MILCGQVSAVAMACAPLYESSCKTGNTAAVMIQGIDHIGAIAAIWGVKRSVGETTARCEACLACIPYPDWTEGWETVFS